MKKQVNFKLICVLHFVFIQFFVNAQEVDIKWTKEFNGIGYNPCFIIQSQKCNESIFSLIATNNNAFFAKYSKSKIKIDSINSHWVLKMDLNGNILWAFKINEIKTDIQFNTENFELKCFDNLIYVWGKNKKNWSDINSLKYNFIITINQNGEELYHKKIEEDYLFIKPNSKNVSLIKYNYTYDSLQFDNLTSKGKLEFAKKYPLNNSRMVNCEFDSLRNLICLFSNKVVKFDSIYNSTLQLNYSIDKFEMGLGFAFEKTPIFIKGNEIVFSYEDFQFKNEKNSKNIYQKKIYLTYLNLLKKQYWTKVLGDVNYNNYIVQTSIINDNINLVFLSKNSDSTLSTYKINLKCFDKNEKKVLDKIIESVNFGGSCNLINNKISTVSLFYNSKINNSRNENIMGCFIDQNNNQQIIKLPFKENSYKIIKDVYALLNDEYIIIYTEPYKINFVKCKIKF